MITDAKNNNKNLVVFFSNNFFPKSILGFEKWTKINVQK
uniref:Uncharacterized protein n=1 Tax=viral metagenome TaxID=1070528 RepID=A0A6C0KQA5_9ZZZZ